MIQHFLPKRCFTREAGLRIFNADRRADKSMNVAYSQPMIEDFLKKAAKVASLLGPRASRIILLNTRECEDICTTSSNLSSWALPDFCLGYVYKVGECARF